jgi:hypothetical protein
MKFKALNETLEFVSAGIFWGLNDAMQGVQGGCHPVVRCRIVLGGLLWRWCLIRYMLEPDSRGYRELALEDGLEDGATTFQVGLQHCRKHRCLLILSCLSFAYALYSDSYRWSSPMIACLREQNASMVIFLSNPFFLSLEA